MSDRPVVTRIGDDFQAVIPDLYLRFDFKNLHDERNRSYADLTITCDNEAMFNVYGELFWDQGFNLGSVRARSSCADELQQKWADGAQWPIVLHEVCRLVVRRHQMGEPFLDLSGERRQSPRYRLNPLLPDGQITLAFGDGGTGKGYFAMAAALSIAIGRPILGMAGIQSNGALGYLDWETDAEEIGDRWARVCEGSLVKPPRLAYRRCVAPIGEDIQAIMRWRAEQDIALLIVDSMGLAVGGNPNDSGDTLRAMGALRSLNCTILALDHQGKAADTPGQRPGKSMGNCYAADTEVLTEHGWMLHQALTGKELVASVDPHTQETKWVYPEQIHRYTYSGPMIHVKGHAVDLLVTPNHRLLTKPAWRQQEPWCFIEARELSMKHHGDWLFPTAPCASTQGTSINPDLARFIGWFISEGSFAHKGKNKPCARYEIGQADGPLADEIWAVGHKLGFTGWRKHYVPTGTRPWSRMIFADKERLSVSLLHECGEGARNKRLPDSVWTWDYVGRLQLMVGLWEGDGHWHQNGRSGVLTTMSEALANDVQRLALSLGWSSSIRARTFGFGVNVTRERTQTCLRLSRHLTEEQYDGEVYCLTVPTGAYIIRRNGTACICANSYKFHHARSVWELKQGESHRDGVVELGLFHHKSNNGRRSAPLALRIEFDGDDGPVTFDSKIKASDIEGVKQRVSIGKRILDALDVGGLLPTELREQLEDVKEDSIQKALRRLSVRGYVTLAEGRYHHARTVR